MHSIHTMEAFIYFYFAVFISIPLLILGFHTGAHCSHCQRFETVPVTNVYEHIFADDHLWNLLILWLA